MGINDKIEPGGIDQNSPKPLGDASLNELFRSRETKNASTVDGFDEKNEQRIERITSRSNSENSRTTFSVSEKPPGNAMHPYVFTAGTVKKPAQPEFVSASITSNGKDLIPKIEATKPAPSREPTDKNSAPGPIKQVTVSGTMNSPQSESDPIARSEAKPVNGQASNRQDLLAAPGSVSAKAQITGTVEPGAPSGDFGQKRTEAPRIERGTTNGGGISEAASDVKLASGANPVRDYAFGAQAKSKSQPRPQPEPQPAAERSPKPGEPVLGRSASGGRILDGASGGVIESRATTTPGTKPQAEPPRADGGVNRLETMPFAGKDSPLTRGQQSALNVEAPRPGSSDSPNVKTELSAGTKPTAKPSENPGGSMESPTATSAKAPKLEPIPPSQPQGVPPVKAGDVSVAPTNNPQGRGMPEVPAGKVPQPHVSDPIGGSKSDGAKSDGTKSDGTRPPVRQPQSVEVPPSATGPDGKRIDVQIPTTKAGIAGGVKTDAPTSKAQTDATKPNSIGNKGDANNPPGKPTGDARTVRGQGSTSASSSELDARQGKERAAKQVEGREPGGDKTPKSPGSIEATTKVPGNQNVAAEIDKTRVSSGKSDSRPTPTEAGAKAPSGINSGGASSDAPVTPSGKSSGADGSQRVQVDAEPHQATGKFGPLDAAPAGIKRGFANGVRSDVNSGSKGEQASIAGGKRGTADVQPTKGSIAPGMTSGKTGETALIPQPGRRGDAGLTQVGGARGDARASEPQSGGRAIEGVGGRPSESPGRRPLIESARVDAGSARTDGPNGRAARAEAIDGRVGFVRSQGADGRAAGAASSLAGVKVETSGPRGSKRAFGNTGKVEGFSNAEAAKSDAVKAKADGVKSDAAKVQTARIEPTKVEQFKVEPRKLESVKSESGSPEAGKAPAYKGDGEKTAGVLGAKVGEFVKANFDNTIKANSAGIKYGAVEGAKGGAAGSGKSVVGEEAKIQIKPPSGAKNIEPNGAKIPLGGVTSPAEGVSGRTPSSNPSGRGTLGAIGDGRVSDVGDSKKAGDKRSSTEGSAKKGPFELAPGSLDNKPLASDRAKPPAALPQAENPHGIIRGDRFVAKPLSPAKPPMEQGKPLAPEGEGAGLNAGLGAPLRGVREALGDLGQKFIEKISRTLGEPKQDLTKTQPIKLVHGLELAKLLSTVPVVRNRTDNQAGLDPIVKSDGIALNAKTQPSRLRGEMPTRAETQLQTAKILNVTRRMLNGVTDVPVSKRAIDVVKQAPRLELPTVKATALHRLEAAAINAQTVPVIDRSHHPVEIRTQRPTDARLQQPLETKPTPVMEAHTVRVDPSEFRPMTGRPSTADSATKRFERLQPQERPTAAAKMHTTDARPKRRDGEPVDGRHEGETPKHIRDVFLKFNISIPKRSFHPAITDSGSYVALDETSSQRLNSFISSGTHKVVKEGTEYERRSNRSGWQRQRESEAERAEERIAEEDAIATRSDAVQEQKQQIMQAQVSTTGDTGRKVYIVQSGDTAESIAFVQLRDERLDGLIEEINHLLLQKVFDANKGKHVLVLPVGAMILLPNSRDIAKYRERSSSD